MPASTQISLGRNSRRIVAMLAAAALVAAGAVLGSPLRAAADTPVGSWSALKSAVAAGGTVILTASITSTGGEGLDVPGAGATTIDLAGYSLTVTSPSTSHAGIMVPANSILTIADSVGGGQLSATGGNESAAIGGNLGGTGGDVTITGGAVTVKGGFRGAAIGGGRYGGGGDVIISGGSLVANGGAWSSGVGPGSQAGSAGTITIYGTRLPGTAGTTGGSYDAADGSYGAAVTLATDPRYVGVWTSNSFPGQNFGGLSVVYAPGSTVLPVISTTTLPAGAGGEDYSAAISYSGDPAPSIAITEGVLPLGLTFGADGTLSGTPLQTGDFPFTVSATSEVLGVGQVASQAYTLTIADDDHWALLQARFAYGGDWALDGDVTGPVGEGLVVPVGVPVGLDLAGFDLTINATGGEVPGISVPDGSDFTATDSVGGGLLDVTGGTRGAGIGGARYASSGAITLDDIEVEAHGGQAAAGIGGGDQGNATGQITISDSDVTSTGGMFAAGIGGGSEGAGGPVTLTDSDVTATGGTYAAGIGGGANGSGGDVSTSGGSLTARGGTNAAGAGAGEGGVSGGTLSVGGIGLEGSGTSGGTSGSSTVTPAAAVTFTGSGPLVRVTSTDTGSSIGGKVEVAYAPVDETLPEITTTGLDSAYRDEDYSAEIEFTGVPEPELSLTSGTLPPGIELSEDGELSGTPTALGDYTFTVTATSTVFDLPQTVSRAFTIPVQWRAYVELKDAFANGGTVSLIEDMVLPVNDTLAVTSGPVTLDLAGHDLAISATTESLAGIWVPGGSVLTIEDSVGGGTLVVSAGDHAAGIGGRYNGTDSWGPAGTITITGGLVTATGGDQAAGIGGGLYGALEGVTITGGEVHAYGSGANGGTGIGAGAYAGTPGPIEISGGIVEAIGTNGGAGIGGGPYGGPGLVTISGGKVTATSTLYGGAGIGGGAWYSGGPGRIDIVAQPLQGSTGTNGGSDLDSVDYGYAVASQVNFTGGESYANVVSVDARPTNPRSVTIEIFSPDDVPGFSSESDFQVDLGAVTSIQLTNDAVETSELTSGTLPAGLEFSATGELHGTPTELGTEAFTVEVTGDVDGLPQVYDRTFTVSTVLRPWEDLQDAFTVGGSAVLSGDLTAPLGEALAVGSGKYIELDLAGHDLVIPAPTLAIPGIAVPLDGTLAIVDSVGGGSLTVTGGQDAAGIGSAAGEYPGFVTIGGGTITAHGGPGGAGIGAGYGITDLGASQVTMLAQNWPGGVAAAGSGSYGDAGAMWINPGPGSYSGYYFATSTDAWAGSATITVGSGVFFDATGGAPVPDAQFVATGGLANEPAAPHQYGAAFTGWFTDSSLTVPFDFSAPIVESTTATAGWVSTIGTLSGSVTFPSWFDSSFGLGDIIATPLQGGPGIAIGVANYDPGLQRGDFLFGLEPGQYLLRYAAPDGSGVASQYWPGVTTAAAAGRLTVVTDDLTTADVAVDGAAVTGVVELPSSAVVDPGDYVGFLASVVAGGVVVDQAQLPVFDPSVLPIAEPFTLTVPQGTTDYQVVFTATVHDGCDCSLITTWRSVWSPSAPLGSDPTPVDLGTIELATSNAIFSTASGPLDAIAAIVPIAYVLEGSTWRQLDVIDDPIAGSATDYSILTGVDGDAAPWFLGLLDPGAYRFGLQISDVDGVYMTWFVNDAGGSLYWSDAQTYTVGASSEIVIPEQTLSAFEPVTDLQNVVTPTIGGTAQVGQALTANPGIWLPAPPLPVTSPCGCVGSFEYQWFRGGIDIPGAVGPVYWVQPGDVGANLSVVVTASTPGLAPGVAASVQTTPVVLGVFVRGTPAITGSALVGSQLSIDPGIWSPVPTSYLFQWYRNGVAIAGETGPTHDVTSDDYGTWLVARVWGSATGYVTANAYSPARRIGAGTFIKGTPSITGSATVGSELTADPGVWSPSPTSFSYQWFRNGVAITGATGATHDVTSDDYGTSLAVRVTGSSSGYVSANATSASRRIGAGTFVAGTPAITGSATVGAQLSADTGTWSPVPTTFTYQWFRNGVAIPGSTAATHDVTIDDYGTWLVVRVWGSSSGYLMANAYSPSRRIGTGVFVKGTPSITGSATVGATLTIDPGAWSPVPTTFTYQWFRNGVAIPGETNATYQVAPGDHLTWLVVRVWGASTGYVTANAYSPSRRIS
jgi:hypothetical protein